MDDYFIDAYYDCPSDQHPYAWTNTPHTKCDICKRKRKNNSGVICSKCKWSWGKDGVLKAWCVGCKYSANNGLDCLSEGSVCVCPPDAGYSFKIGPDGGLICMKDGKPVSIEQAESQVKAWLKDPMIRKPQNVRLWEAFCKKYEAEPLNTNGTYVRVSLHLMWHYMKDDFVSNPAAKIENLKKGIDDFAAREKERLDQWWNGGNPA